MTKLDWLTLRSFQPLLAAELKQGRGLIETRLTTWPVEKLEKEGYCLRNLDGYWLENKDPTSKTAVAGFACEPGQELPWHAFQYALPFKFLTCYSYCLGLVCACWCPKQIP